MSKKPSVEIAKMAGGAGKILQPFDPLDFLDEAVDFFKTREREQTERARIRADRDSFVEATQAKKEIFLEVTGRQFDEREQVIGEVSALMHRAQAEGNHETVQEALRAMQAVTKENPLKGMSELADDLADSDS